MTKTKRAALYARVSRNDLEDGHGVNAQLKACREVAERAGLEVVAEFADDDRSAWSSKRKRTGYAQMLATLDEIDVLVAWSPDRVTRRTKELIELIDRLNETNTGVMTVQGGVIDLATADGRFQARLAGVLAERESDLKSERNKLRHAEVAADGRPNGGTRPYGFADDRVTHDPAEVAVIREAADRVLAGESLCSITRDFNERGLRSAQDRSWRVPTLRTIITSPRVAGFRSHRGQLTSATWEPILTPEKRAQLVAVCSTNKGSRGKPRRLLSGLAECGKCGAGLRSRVRTSSGRVEYVCLSQPGVDACGALGVQGDALEEFVTEVAFAVLDNAELADAVVTDDEPSAALAELARIESRRDEFARLAATGDIGPADYSRFVAALESEQYRLQATVADEVVEARRRTVSAGVLREKWPTWGIPQRRAVLDDMIERLVVKPGRLPIDERVEITWRA